MEKWINNFIAQVWSLKYIVPAYYNFCKQQQEMLSGYQGVFNLENVPTKAIEVMLVAMDGKETGSSNFYSFLQFCKREYNFRESVFMFERGV